MTKYGQGRGGRPWRRKRDRILKRDHYLCQPCKRLGKVKQGNQVDHIIPLAKDGTDDDKNLQTICGPCHEAKTLRDMGIKPIVGCDADGWPEDASHSYSSTRAKLNDVKEL